MCSFHISLTFAHSCVYVRMLSVFRPILPLRKNLLGSKHKANNYYFEINIWIKEAIIICFVLIFLGEFAGQWWIIMDLKMKMWHMRGSVSNQETQEETLYASATLPRYNQSRRLTSFSCCMVEPMVDWGGWGGAGRGLKALPPWFSPSPFHRVIATPCTCIGLKEEDASVPFLLHYPLPYMPVSNVIEANFER